MSGPASDMSTDPQALTELTRARERELLVMLVEDDDGDALLVEELLHDGLPEARLIRARSIEQAVTLLDDHVSCVLLDLGLPDSVGMDGVRQLHQRRDSVAIVVLTGANDETLGIRAVGEGAQDYLVKGQADDRVLARSLLYAVERQRSEEVSRQLYEVERRQEENARMERALLPHPVVSSDDVTLSVAYRPGNEGAELGGDFYDAVELDDGGLRIVIGDVSGHGPDEAALGAALRSSWRALVLAGLATHDVLTTLDRQLRTERPDELRLRHAVHGRHRADPAPGVVDPGRPPGAVHALARAPARARAHPGPAARDRPRSGLAVARRRAPRAVVVDDVHGRPHRGPGRARRGPREPPSGR